MSLSGLRDFLVATGPRAAAFLPMPSPLFGTLAASYDQAASVCCWRYVTRTLGPSWPQSEDGFDEHGGPPLAEGEISVTLKGKSPSHFVIFAAISALLCLTPRPAEADFFDGARRTFQTDIPHFFTHDVPHFFQDDVPCAFGGQPTSGTKTSCDAPPDNAPGNAPTEPPPEKPEPAAPPANNGH